MSPRPSNRMAIKQTPYTARPKRSEMRDGVLQHYWTVRCRREDNAGEWSLGWFPTRRSAEDAFQTWVAKHQKAKVPNNGRAVMADVLDVYVQAVDTMTGMRPKTRENRKNVAARLQAFIAARAPSLTVHEFRAETFEQYLTWLKSDKGYQRNTVLGSLIGARTFLRWAALSGYVQDPPRAPAFDVPPLEHAAITEEDITALIHAADHPFDLFLRVLWETGMRFSEVACLRRSDIDLADDDDGARVLVREHGGFVPKTKSSERKIPVSRDLGEALVGLCSDRDGPLFAVDVKHAYHYWNNLLRRAQVQAGVRRFTFHALRCAMADRLRRNGEPVDLYCRYMGHSPITGLRHYSVVTTDDLAAAHDKALTNARRRDRSNRGS